MHPHNWQLRYRWIQIVIMLYWHIFSTRVNNHVLTFPEFDLLQYYPVKFLSQPWHESTLRVSNQKAEYTHWLLQLMYSHASVDMILKVHCQSKKILSRRVLSEYLSASARMSSLHASHRLRLRLSRRFPWPETHTVQSLTENHVSLVLASYGTGIMQSIVFLILPSHIY